MDLRSDVLQLSDFNANDPVAGGVFDAVGFALGIPSGRFAENLLDIPDAVRTINNANTVLNASESKWDFT
ncbi:MAG: hypothetical protein L3J89_14925 [Gammaproteobacteria bacterium]|nr:hypothetical protein [Gammaproteobacteria bacterium]